MHIGRWYRRINPPNWFRGLSEDYQPAAQWDVLANWTYAGISMVTRPPFRVRPSEINMKAGFVEWAGKYTAGVYDFGWKHRFQLKRGIPDVEWAIRIVDNVGSLLEASILCRHGFNFGAGRFVWTVFGTFTVQKFGLWGGLDSVQLHPVSYHEEP